MPETCPFTATWEEIPIGLLPKISPPLEHRGGFSCLCSVGHRDSHLIEVEGIVIAIPKRAPGRPPSADPLSEVLWVRIPQATAQAIDELRGDDRSRSDVVRELIDKALQRGFA